MHQFVSVCESGVLINDGRKMTGIRKIHHSLASNVLEKMIRYEGQTGKRVWELRRVMRNDHKRF